jgi:hypothetical protein
LESSIQNWTFLFLCKPYKTNICKLNTFWQVIGAVTKIEFKGCERFDAFGEIITFINNIKEAVSTDSINDSLTKKREK